MIMNSRRRTDEEPPSVADVAAVIATLSNKVTRLREEIRTLKLTGSDSRRNLRHVNDKDDRRRAKRVTRFTHSSPPTTTTTKHNDDDDNVGVPTTTTKPGRREEESRESKRNFSHGRKPLSCRERAQYCRDDEDGDDDDDDDGRRKRALFNAPRKNRPREETEDAGTGNGSEEDSTPPFEGGDVIKCKIRRKRISRGVQYEEPCHKKNHIILSCFQSQNITSEELYGKKNTENGKCHISVQCSTKERSPTLKEDSPTKRSPPRNMHESTAAAAIAVISSDNERRDARRYAGVGNGDGRNRPPAEEATSVPHRRSEINEEVKATLTGADKQRRRGITMPDSNSGNSKSRTITAKEKAQTGNEGKGVIDTKDNTKKSSSKKKRKTEKVIDKSIEKRKNNKTRKTSLATGKKKNTSVINTVEEAKKRANKEAAGLKNATTETKKNDKSKMKNLPKEKKKKDVSHDSKDKNNARKTSLSTAKGKKVHTEDKKKVNWDVIKKKSTSRDDVKIKSNSSDSQYSLIKGKLSYCTKELYRLIQKASGLCRKERGKK